MALRLSRYIFNSNWAPVRWALAALVGVGVSMLWGSAERGNANEAEMCAVTKRALEAASRIRGLSVATAVPCVVRSRPQIEAFIREMIAEKFPKDTLEMEQLMYRAIGLVPDDYDYVRGIVSAYVQQIGGYYDPDKKLFVMLDTMPKSLHVPVAVHELTHALQDQRFNLTAFLDPTKMDSDELMARAALVEGDATAVMQDYMSSRRAKDGGSTEGAAVDVPEQIPAALERVLLFPYIQGLSFTRRIIREGGFAAVNDAFARPPSTSREILHPEQYTTRAFMPKPLDVSDVERARDGGAPIFTDTVGEFIAASLFEDALSSQARAEGCAEGLKRDKLAVFDVGDKTRTSWMSEWDSVSEAQEFFDCYREMLKVRYQRDVQGELIAVSATKRIKIERADARVSIVVEVAK